MAHPERLRQSLLLVVVPSLLVAVTAAAQDERRGGADGVTARGDATSGDETPGASKGEGSAGEQAAPTPERATPTAQAKQHFQAGMAHFEARRFRDAIRSFELAATLVPSADLWFNIGRAHEELSEYEQAARYYRRYLRDRVEPPDREEVERHVAWLEDMARRRRSERLSRAAHGRLRVDTDPDGAQLRVQDKSLGASPLRRPVDLQPGRHRLEAERSGYIPFRSEVQVHAGSTTAAYADMQRKTEFRTVRGTRVLTWVAAGLGGAALVTAGVLGVVAKKRRDDGELDAADRWATRSDIALGTALALGVGAVILYFAEGRAMRTERLK